MKRKLYYTIHIDRETIDNDLSCDTGWKTVYVYEIIDCELIMILTLELELKKISQVSILEELNLSLEHIDLILLWL